MFRECAFDMNEADEYEQHLKKLKSTELWQLCVHESAHAAVAHYFDAVAAPVIEANPHVVPGEDNHYLGRTEVATILPTAQRRLVALAGTVAELFDKNRGITGDWISRLIKLKNVSLSPRDAEGAGDYTTQHLDECVALVGELWPKIESEALQLKNLHTPA